MITAKIGDNFPTTPTPPAMVTWLRALAGRWETADDNVRPFVLMALACQLDRTGRGLEAAEIRGAAGLLWVRFAWYHPPTRLVSARTFTDRSSAWMHLSRMFPVKGLRNKVLRNRVPAGTRLRPSWGTFRHPNGRYVSMTNIPVTYADPTTLALSLPVSEMTLIATVMSGYAARVTQPCRTGVGGLWPEHTAIGPRILPGL